MMPCWETMNLSRCPNGDAKDTLEGVQADIVLATSLENDV
jgi:hypothetical protein